MKITHASRLCVAAFLALTIAATTGSATKAKGSTDLRTERRSGGGVEVRSVCLESTDGGLRISGAVTRAVGYINSSRRHADVDVLDADGTTLVRRAVRFIPDPIRHNPRSSSMSSYVVTLPESPPPGGVIRVAVHSTSLLDCHN
jgi:hypothetical protein